MTKTLQGPPAPFTMTDALKASFEWGMSCGPAALAALLGLMPDEIRPHVCGPEGFRGHMNTRDMMTAIRLAGWRSSGTCSPSGVFPPLRPASFGVARIQWGGTWLNPGVHPGAAASRTHWIASRLWDGEMWIYDINSGWTLVAKWAAETVPKIIAEVKRCDGTWRFTDVIEVWKLEDQ